MLSGGLVQNTAVIGKSLARSESNLRNDAIERCANVDAIGRRSSFALASYGGQGDEARWGIISERAGGADMPMGETTANRTKESKT